MPETWDSGDAYEQYVGRWSRQIATLFIDWLDVSPGAAWLDVGCGTGALSSEIAESASPSRMDGIDPSKPFIEQAASKLSGPLFSFQVGDAQSIPHPDSTFDVTASALVLTFIPDPSGGVREMLRVTKPGGIVAAYVWDYAGEMQMMKYFWDLADELFTSAREAHEGLRFGLAHPDELAALFERNGLLSVATAPLEIPTRFASFDDYWRPFLGGQGPAPGFVRSLGTDDRRRLRERLEQRLPVSEDGAIDLTARAWAVRGRTPA